MPTIIHWIEQLPDEVVRARPRLFQAYVGLLILSVRYDEARRLLDGLGAASFASAGASAHATLRGWGDAIRAGLSAGFGDIATAHALIEQAQTRLAPHDDYEQATLSVAQSYLMEAQGRPTSAIDFRRAAIRRYQAAGRIQPALVAMVSVSEYLHMHGRLHEAWQTAQDVVDQAACLEDAPSAMSGAAFVEQAGVLYEWDRLDEALDLTLRAVTLAEMVGTRICSRLPTRSSLRCILRGGSLRRWSAYWSARAARIFC
ncbi:MAG: hypothetical protein HC828_13550 [Blastochloris sp.]|nr:hypothetical protein [Blastochloris sp.]